MANPSSGLVLRFSTDLGQAQRDLVNFAANAASNLATVATRAIETKKALDFLAANAGAIKLGAIGFVGFEAVAATLRLLSAAAVDAQENLEKLVRIGAQAQTADVGTTFLQSWTGQAKALNAEASSLVAMLDRARAAATQTIGVDGGTSASPGADRIRQNVLAGNLPGSALSSYDDAQGQEARLRVVLDLIEQLQQKGAQLAAFDLARTFFGDGFESRLRDGVDMIGKMRASLDGLDAAGGERVIPQAEIARAQQLQSELDAINDKLARGMKPILDDIAAWQQDDLASLVQIRETWASIVEVAGQLWKVCSEIGATLRGWGNAIGNADAFRDLLGAFQSSGFLNQRDVHVLSDDERAAMQGGGERLPAITVRGDRSNALPSLTPRAAHAAAPAEKTDPVETYINSLKKQTAAEEAEARTLGLGNKAKQEAIDLAKAQQIASERGTPLAAAETAEILKQADAYVAARQQIDVYNRAQEDAKGQAEFFGQTLESAFGKLTEPGARIVDVLKSVAQALEQASLKVLLLGEGPLAGLFGTAAPVGATGSSAVGGLAGLLFHGFDGAHAAGGTIGAGKWGIAGEKGAEIISGPATVTPVAQINAALASGGGRGAGNSSRVVNIDARGAQAGVAEQIAASLKAYDDRLDRGLAARVSKSEKRYL